MISALGNFQPLLIAGADHSIDQAVLLIDTA